MLLADLRTALTHAEEIKSKLIQEAPDILHMPIKVGATCGYGTIFQTMNNLESFRNGASLFIPSQLRMEALIIQALIEKIEFHKDNHRNKMEFIITSKKSFEDRLEAIVPMMFIDETSRIEFIINECDHYAIEFLRHKIKVRTGRELTNKFSVNRVTVGFLRDFHHK